VDAPRSSIYFFYLPAADDWRRPPSGPRKTFPTHKNSDNKQKKKKIGIGGDTMGQH
jgi:hypothetical protein